MFFRLMNTPLVTKTEKTSFWNFPGFTMFNFHPCSDLYDIQPLVPFCTLASIHIVAIWVIYTGCKMQLKIEIYLVHLAWDENQPCRFIRSLHQYGSGLLNWSCVQKFSTKKQCIYVSSSVTTTVTVLLCVEIELREMSIVRRGQRSLGATSLFNLTKHMVVQNVYGSENERTNNHVKHQKREKWPSVDSNNVIKESY